MPVNRSPLPPPDRPAVYVAGGDGPYRNTRRVLDQIGLGRWRGKRVLLKPNAGRVAPSGSGIVTHAEVVAAAMDAFRQAGAEVVVGESPIVGVDVAQAFEASGIGAMAAQRGCRLIDLDRRRPVQLAVPRGRAIRKLKVCADVLEADCLVSLPVMKMHMHTGVTLAVKNMKGCLWRRSKVELHMLAPVADSEHKPIDIAIADMASVLRAHVAIIDGTVAMEGLGPSAGRARPMDVVVASTDPFAADAVACRLMGTDARRVPHLQIGGDSGSGLIDLNRIDVAPGNWQQWITPLAPPPENLTLHFPGVIVLDNKSCSACQSTLLLLLKRHRQRLLDYFPDRQRVHIAIGKGHQSLPPGALCVGNCTAHVRQAGIFVPGCPPVGSQILAAASGQPSAAVTDGGPREDERNEGR